MIDDQITSTVWILTNLAGPNRELGAALPDVRATLEFADGRIGGSASCNRFFAEGSLDDMPLHFALTMMMCPEPVMEQERVYLSLLSEINTAQVEEGRLVARDETGSMILVWTPEV